MLSIVIDAETKTHNKVGKNKASPWSKDNDIVYFGYRGISSIPSPRVGDIHLDCVGSYDAVTLLLDFKSMLTVGSDVVIVGHNVKFDLGYLIRNDEFRDMLFKGKLQVWDTQLAHAMMTGYVKRFPSLDYVSTFHKLPLKDDRMKAYWDKGISTEDIPEDEILPYLEQDVLNTSRIYQDQMIELAHNPQLLENITLQMGALVTTLAMEYNGMHFDTKRAADIALGLEFDKGTLDGKLISIMEDANMVDPNPASVTQVANYLYGGQAKYDTKIPMTDAAGDVVRFKSGKSKGMVRMIKKRITVDITPALKSITKSRGTGDKQLKDIVKHKLCPAEVAAFCNALMESRKLGKEISTYYRGYSEHTWSYDDCIRTTFNHTATPTGRLSSTNPNIQNVTRKDT